MIDAKGLYFIGQLDKGEYKTEHMSVIWACPIKTVEAAHEAAIDLRRFTNLAGQTASVVVLHVVEDLEPSATPSRVLRKNDRYAPFIAARHGGHAIGFVSEIDLDTRRGIQIAPTDKTHMLDDHAPGGAWVDLGDGMSVRDFQAEEVCVGGEAPDWVRSQFPDLPVASAGETEHT